MPASTQAEQAVVDKAAQTLQAEQAGQVAKSEGARLLPDQIALPETKVHSNRWVSISFVLIVIAPTILTGIYYAFIASDQYESRTLFAVRGLSESPLDALGFTNIIGGSGVQQTDTPVWTSWRTTLDGICGASPSSPRMPV